MMSKNLKKNKGIKKFILTNLNLLKENNISFEEYEINKLSFGWHNIGNACIVSIPQILKQKKIEIAKTLMLLNKKNNKCIDVVIQNNGITGNLRLPKLEVLYPKNFMNHKYIEVIHHENKCKFKLDILNIMFSKGNLYEKKRISTMGNREVIVDMFAGIGYFSVPLAIHSNPKVIYSIELNQQSYYYLCENIKLNSTQQKIIPILGNCVEKVKKSIADRVIMGYFDTENYLKYGIECLKDDGGYLHYHELTLRKYYPLKQITKINQESQLQNKYAIIKNIRIVKKYSSNKVHVSIDAYIFKINNKVIVYK